jgi:hypothetical protein
MEAVHILVGTDGQQHFFLIEVLGQRQLDQDAVNVLPAIEGLHQFQQLLLGGFRGDSILLAVNAALGAVLLLSVYVHTGGGVISHQHHSQAGLALHARHLGRYFLLHLGRQGLAVHMNGRHVQSSFVSSACSC